MKLSVHIVTAQRPHLLKLCLNSVLKAIPESSEVIVIVNGPCSETERYLQQCRSSLLSWIVVPKESRCKARNRAFEIARGDVIYFLDDDVVVPEFLFKDALQLFENYSISVLGGPNLTPIKSSIKEHLFGAVMTSWFAAPGVRARYGGGVKCGRPKVYPTGLILCNLAIRRADVPVGIRFQEFLRSNEENLLIQQCLELKLNVLFAPMLYVFHRRRSTLREFLSQISSYGFGRAQQTWFAPRFVSLPFLVPAIGLVTFPLLFLFNSAPFISFSLLLYFILSLSSAFFSSAVRTLGAKAILKIALLTAAVHSAYAVGLLRGFWFCFRTKRRGNLNERHSVAPFFARHLEKFLPRKSEASSNSF